MRDPFGFRPLKKRPAIYFNDGCTVYSVQAERDGLAGNEDLIKAVDAARKAFLAE